MTDDIEKAILPEHGNQSDGQPSADEHHHHHSGDGHHHHSSGEHHHSGGEHHHHSSGEHHHSGDGHHHHHHRHHRSENGIKKRKKGWRGIRRAIKKLLAKILPRDNKNETEKQRFLKRATFLIFIIVVFTFVSYLIFIDNLDETLKNAKSSSSEVVQLQKQVTGGEAEIKRLKEKITELEEELDLYKEKYGDIKKE